MPALILAHARRERHTIRLVQYLQSIGIRSHIRESTQEPPDPKDNILGTLALLERAPAGKGVLFLEDDAWIDAGTFPHFLRAAIDQDALVTFCLLRDDLLPRGYKDNATGRLVPLERVSARRGFHGTIAMHLPERVIQRALTDAPSILASGHGLDFWLKEHADEFGGLYAAMPNPVQHMDTDSLLTPHRRVAMRSSSFGSQVLRFDFGPRPALA